MPLLAYYYHGNGCAIVGGYVYRGRQSVSMRGRYVFGDYCAGARLVLDPDQPTPSVVRLLDLDLTVVSFGEALDGELLVVSLTGAVYRVAMPR